MRLLERVTVLLVVSGLIIADGQSVSYSSADECSQNDDVLLLPLKASHAIDIRDEFDAFFGEASSDCLKALKHHRETTVAIRAAWEEAKRAIQSSRDGDVRGARRPEVERFLGFVEGRLNIAIPRRWEYSMRAARGGYRHIGFGEVSVLPTFSQELSVWLSPDLHVKVGHRCELTVGSKTVRLNRATFDKLMERGEIVWKVFVLGANCYVVAFDGMGNLLEVLRVNGLTGEEVWRANAWGTGWVWRDGRGEPGYSVDMLESCGTVYVFGSGGVGGVIEGYDIQSGNVILRFATTNWRQPDKKTEEAELDRERRRTEREPPNIDE